MSTSSAEAKQLLAASPEDFVAERKRLVAELRKAGRDEDARTLAELRKPSAVVLAVNRAARDRPQAAKDAVAAAEKVAKAQLSGDADVYRQSLRDLEDALALLAEVAVANLSRAKPATEAMRRRVADLLRSASADPEAREALQKGLLQDEGDAAGFSAFVGVSAPARPRRAGPGRAKEAERKEKAKREREQRLEKELAHAEEALEAAEKALVKAQRERDKAARAVTSAAERLERLQGS
jgi:hypothetical protein